MKKICPLFASLLIVGSLMAQAPQGFKYQAVIRDGSGVIIADQQVGLQISILQSSIDGTAVYVETFAPNTNKFGLINLNIGEGTVVSGGFTTIDWSSDTYFVKMEMDIAGGTSYEEYGTSQLLSVPYALHALTAGNTFGGNYDDLSNKPELSVSIYGDTLFLSKSNFVIVPGISAVNNLTVKDIDGNVYEIVEIGDQVWMAENLKVTHYSDGTAIPLVEANSAWDALEVTDKAYCYYDNSTANRDVYGALYSWATAMNGATSCDSNPGGVQGVCPAGWHLPSDAEWLELIYFLGGGSEGSVAGGKLKETGTTHWNSPNSDATNSSGFTALPGGYRFSLGSFNYLGSNAMFWSSTEYIHASGMAWILALGYNYSMENRHTSPKEAGYSVRCLRDQ